MKRLLLLLLFVIICCNSFSQTMNYRYAIRTSPLSLLDPLLPNFTLGGEIKIAAKKSLGLDVSMYMPYDNAIKTEGNTNVNNLYFKYSGFIIKPMFRYYYKETKYKNRQFVEPDIMFKFLTATSKGWVQRNVDNGIPAYNEYTDFSISKFVVAGNVKIGIQTKLFNIDNAFFEFYAGLGMRYVHQSPSIAKTDRISADSRFSNGWLVLRQSYNTTYDYFIPSMTMGIRFGYSFK